MALGKPGAFLRKFMEKTKKNRLKDYRELKGKRWVYLPTPYAKRKSGSGVTFDGKYVDK